MSELSTDAEISHRNMLRSVLAYMGRYVLDVVDSEDEERYVWLRAVNEGGLRKNNGQEYRRWLKEHSDTTGLTMLGLTESELIEYGVKIPDSQFEDESIASDRQFVLHAQAVADAINQRNTPTHAGFAACNGFTSTKTFNYEEKRYE